MFVSVFVIFVALSSSSCVTLCIFVFRMSSKVLLSCLCYVMYALSCFSALLSRDAAQKMMSSRSGREAYFWQVVRGEDQEPEDVQ